jgi:predicted NUDIX family phosphoesterase
MGTDLKEEQKKLEKLAGEVFSHLAFASRAFVLELAGTPKSGKSTAVEAIRHFFTRNGFRVHVLAERAGVCPIPMKGHLFFNTWCAASMLAELLANVETVTDIIIVDRGLFDALVWMTMQEDRGELTEMEARTIESFLLLGRWRSLIDLAVVMSVSPDEAIRRENSQRITEKPGSIMNSDILTSILSAVKKATSKYSAEFGGLIHHETTGQGVREANVQLASDILFRFEEFLNPEVLAVSESELKRLKFNDGGAFGDAAVSDAHMCIREHGKFIRRSEVECSKDYVQIAPCAILTYQDEVFLFQRKEADPKSRLYGKTTILRGCHVSNGTGGDSVDLLRISLQEKISQSLHLSRVFEPTPLGYCWDFKDDASNRHFGMVHKVVIDNQLTALNLRNKEFRKQRGYSVSGRFLSVAEIRDKQSDLKLENWSRIIIRNKVL